ncbi:MAG: hypothetical protein DRJ42_29735 [Deltaproteobacteria bacterium]|nr:MAG: hypothetical protein DRJ42_29735 [Deltaproteobacteria bacterium]
MKIFSTLLVALSVVTGAACGDDSPASDGGADGSAMVRDSAVGPDSAPRDATVFDDCTDEANKKVWILTTDLGAATRESHLLRFDPELLTYTDIGELRCELEGTNILRSMAVDRAGTAWVSSSRGALYRVDTTTAACVATGMETGQEQVRNYGMGFATVGDTTEERLFITAEGGWWMDGLAYRRLGAIDTSTLGLSIIGDIDAPTPANMELTGTGDGRLFGMVLDVRNLRDIIVSIELLDAATGGTLERKVAPIEARSGFAFAQWGGDFWLFTEAPDESARVVQFDFDAGTVVQTVDVTLDVPGTIVGAGVSTCAPYDLI